MVTLFPIQSLAKDLSEAEEQYAQALRSHLHSVDQLLALQRCRLNLLEESYNMELETLTKEFETERYGGLSPGAYPVSRSCLLAGGQHPGASHLDYDTTPE